MKVATVLGMVLVGGAGVATGVLYSVLSAPAAPSLATSGVEADSKLALSQGEVAELNARVKALEADLALERELNQRLQAEAKVVAAPPLEEADLAFDDESAESSRAVPMGDETVQRSEWGQRGGWNNEELTEEQVLAMMAGEDRGDLMRALRNIEKVTDRSKALDFIMQQLAGSEGRTRMMAIEALIELGPPDAVPALTALMAEEEGWSQARIARALAGMGDTSVVPALRTAFNGAEEREQVTIALALRDLGDSGAYGEVSQRAINSMANPDGSLRESAVRTLSSLRDPTMNVHLVAALADSNGDVRSLALGALARQGTSSELGAVMDLQNDPNPEVARAAQRAVAMIQNPELRNRRGQRADGAGASGFEGFRGGGGDGGGGGGRNR